MKLKPRYIITTLAVCGTLFATMAYNIKGTAVDDDGEPLIGASVRLLRARDSVAIKTAVADNAGGFTLRDVSRGRYIVEASYVGYMPRYNNVDVSDRNITLDTLRLNPDTYVLRDAVVVGVRTPVKVMEDTIEFAADAYKTAPNAVVEDLLKRLPGVEVGSDGKITSNGKEVTKILVDGKEFFSDDPKVASKNLPVNMIDKLQVVDRKSDLARITGVDDGEEETVINLTVKKGMKNGWFGNAEAGYGTDSRYKGSFTVNRFWNDNQLTLLGGINNINEPGFTDGGGRFRRFGGADGVTTSKALGLNFNVGNGEIFRIGGDVMYSYTDARTTTTRDRQYLFTDSTSYFNADKIARDKGHNVRGDFRLQWKPDSLNTFEFRPNFSYNSSDSYSFENSLTSAGDAARTAVTQSRNTATSNGNSWEFGASLIYNHKFASRPGRSFSVHASINTSNIHEYEDTWSRNLYYLLADQTELYDQYNTNHTWSNTMSARLTWTEPLGNPKKGNYLTLAYNIRYRWNNADRLTYDNPNPDPEGTIYGGLVGMDNLIFNEDLSNSFRNNYMSQDIRLGFKHVTRTQNINAGISLVPQRSSSHDLINSARDIPVRTTFNIAPFLRYRWKISKSRSMNIDYRGRSSQPSMSQLQPVEDKSDPLHIVVGNPDLSPTFTHNLRFRFQDFSSEAQRSIMAMAMASVVQNSIVSNTVFDKTTGGQTTTYNNVNGVWNAFGMFMFSMPFSGLKTLQFNVHTGIRYQHDVGFNNGLRNTSSSLNYDIGPALAWRPDYIELELRPRYAIQSTHNSLQAGSNRTVHTYGGMFYAAYNSPFGLVINSDLNYSATSGYSDGYDTKQWMWNAGIAYQFLRDRSLTLTLKAYDLLAQRKNVRRTVTANYIDDTRYNSLGRYFMVTVAYRFNTFGKGNEPSSRNDDRRGGPGGPPPGRRPSGPPPGGGGRPF